MSVVSHDPNALQAQTAAPSALAGLFASATFDPSELGSPIPQSIFTTDASTRAWDAHVQKLGPKERDFLLKYATGSVESFSSLVQRICTKHQKQSRISEINDLLRPFCKTLGMYMPVASAASQADPYPSSLVIGGIIGLLQISDNFDSYQKLIMKWLSKLSAKAALLMEFDICIYQYDEKIQDALALIYGDILDFCQKALKLYVDEEGKRRSGFVVFGKSLIERFSDTFGEIVDNFEVHLENYKARAELCNSKRLMQIFWVVVNSALQQRDAYKEITDSLAVVRNEMQARHQELRNAHRQAREDIIDSILAGKSEEQAQAAQRDAERKRATENEERIRKEAKKRLVMNWLPSVQFQHTHYERSASVVTGTGTWFRTHEAYQRWKTSTHSNLVWVTGKPGCGKSVLAALTWDELKPLQNENIAVARFYCDSSNPDRSSYLYLLTTLLKQISGQSSRLHHDLEQIYDQEGLIQDRGPGANEVEKLLPVILSGFDQAFIIVDGLDELRESQGFLRFLSRLLRETTSTLRVIVFCRDYLLDHLPIQSTLKGYPQLHVDQGANKDDIGIFISSRLSTDDPDWDTELLDMVKTVLLDRADGMFLYVSLMVSRLRGSLSLNELVDRLKSLPKGLTNAYEANLKRILNQEDEADKILALKILLWIANANRPLSRKELLEALSIRHGRKEKGQGGTDREFATYCAELVYFDHDDFYHLVHTSLRDFLFGLCNNTTVELEDYREMQLHAERTLAEACLTYLLHDQFSAGPVRTAEDLARLLLENPFLQYAAENWGSHVALAAEDAPTDLVWDFIDNENARNLSMQVVMAEENVYPFSKSSSPLHILAYFGLSEFANMRSELRALKHQIDGFGLLPLDYAMVKMGRTMCLWLLEKEADPVLEAGPITARYSAYHFAVILEWNDVLERLVSTGLEVDFVTSNKRRTPLAEAAARGNEWAVRRLLKAKADVNAKDAEGKNPLMIALDGCHQNLVLPLLENGTDIGAQDDDGVSALHIAVDTGNLEATKLLLERKPPVQVTTEKYWKQTPIHLAAEHDYDEIFRELYKYRTELEVPCMGGFRPMHLAAFHNSMKVARLLADLKAEINPVSDEDKTVLHVAAEYSDVEFVELILKINPEVNAKDQECQNTALHAAAAAGKAAVCKLLLDRGATVDLPNATKHTALHLAVTEGHTETAKLLLDHNFSPMKTAVFDSPVLHYAANEGIKELVKPLIEAQADPEAPNIHGHRALHFAARKGHRDFLDQLFTVVPRLDANSQDLEGETALHLAAAAGHLSTVRILLGLGAQPSILGPDRSLPLHYAAWDGHVKIVELLLSDDNMNARGYSGRTVLFIGALRGHESIVRLLLDRNAMLELGDDNQSTPLMIAMKMNHKQIALLLISEGADVRTVDGEHQTLLHRAARNGDYDLVKLLLDRGCDIHAVSNLGDTPFLEAVFSNNLKVIDLFSEHGVDGNGDQNQLGTTSVHAAVQEGNLQMLVKLLNAGANPDSVDQLGRSVLLTAAGEGRHALVEPLLSLGLNVDGLENCYETPLSAACEGGYIRFVETLLQHHANIHIRTKEAKMTPLHQAAAMHQPQIIRKLVDLGADICSRDRYANSPLDYASTHRASFEAIKHDELGYVGLNLADRRTILWRTIRDELECLLSIGRPITLETELTRLLKLAVIATSFLYLRDKDKDQMIKYTYMELCFRADSADLRLSIDCDICKISLNGLDLCVCRECHSVQLCTKCHENYEKGWKGTNSAPEGIKEMERLEKEIEPLREVMLPIIYGIKIQFVFFIFSFFTSVQTWADTKRKEYEAWESKFNENGHYKFRKRPCQQLLELLEEGRVFMKDIEEKGLQFDEQREDCAGLTKKFSDYHRTYNVFRDNDGFDCSGHEYLQVSKKEYDQVRLEAHLFQPDRRLADEWFRELLGKCPPVDDASETGAEPDESLRGEGLKTTRELQEPKDTDASRETFNDRVDVAETAPAVLHETQGEEAPANDDQPRNKGHAFTKKPNEPPAISRPKMPQGLRSSFTPNNALKHEAATEEPKPAVEDKAIIEELQSPTDAVAAFSNLKSADNEAPTSRISNTKRFTADLLERHHNLKRRITSPTLDTEDPFDDSSLQRRATAPFPTVLESQQWTVPHHFKTSPPQTSASQATAGIDLSPPPHGTSSPPATTNTHEPGHHLPSSSPHVEVETPAGGPSSSAGEQAEPKIAVSISNSDDYGRLIMLALSVAESIFPGFGDLFITTRLERGDLEEYKLQLEVERAVPDPGGMDE